MYIQYWIEVQIELFTFSHTIAYNTTQHCLTIRCMGWIFRCLCDESCPYVLINDYNIQPDSYGRLAGYTCWRQAACLWYKPIGRVYLSCVELYYIRQVNGVKLADIMFSLVCVCAHSVPLVWIGGMTYCTCIRLVREKLGIFPYRQYIVGIYVSLAFWWCSWFKIEVGVDEKYNATEYWRLKTSFSAKMQKSDAKLETSESVQMNL